MRVVDSPGKRRSIKSRIRASRYNLHLRWLRFSKPRPVPASKLSPVRRTEQVRWQSFNPPRALPTTSSQPGDRLTGPMGAGPVVDLHRSPVSFLIHPLTMRPNTAPTGMRVERQPGCYECPPCPNYAAFLIVPTSGSW